MSKSQRSEEQDERDCLDGGGEMGALLRTIAWERTDLGATKQWPEPLRHALRLVLRSRTAMAVLWGPGYLAFYNDAFRSLLGNRLAAPGRSLEEAFPEAWPVLEPLLAASRAGEALRFEDWLLPLQRGSIPEEAYFDFASTPIPDARGRHGGILITLRETTPQVLESRRLRLLRDLAAVAARTTGLVELGATLTESLEAAAADLPCAALYVLDDAEASLLSLTPTPERLRFPERIGREGPDPWQIHAAALQGTPQWLTNLGSLVGVVQGRRWPEPVQDAYVVPLSTKGRDTCPGVLIAGLSPRLSFDDDYRAFVEECARLLHLGLRNARRYEDGRRRAESLVSGQWPREAVKGGDRFLAMAEAAPVILCTLEPEGALTYLNPAGFRFLGEGPNEVAGFGWLDRVHPEDRPYVESRFFSARDRIEAFSIEYRLRRHDGAWRWVIGSGAPLRASDGGLAGFVGSLIDVTELKHVENELRDADRRKDEFLAVLGHELRNPLAPIRNAVQILKMAGDDPSISERALTMMERQLQQMVRLVDDLLDVSRITSGKVMLRRERVNLHDVMYSAMEESSPLIKSAGLELAVSLPTEPIVIYADPARLAQVFSNLLNNAAKFTPRGGHIWFSAQQQGGEVVVRVRDDGVGLHPDLLPRLFRPFGGFQYAAGQGAPGLGMGLSIVRGLAERHGGSVEARSEGVGKGSEFVIRLPLGIAQSTPVGDAPLLGEPAADLYWPRRVLVADDSEDCVTSLSMMLQLMGNDVCTAGDGAEAVAAAETFHPEVVLLDLDMPRLDGLEAARRIRQTPWGREALLVALTGWGQEHDRERTRAAGFDHHLVKPVEVATLRDILTHTRPGPLSSSRNTGT